MWERVNQNSPRQIQRKLGRVVYDPFNAENLNPRGKPIPFRYRPDRETYRMAKRALRKEAKKTPFQPEVEPRLEPLADG